MTNTTLKQNSVSKIFEQFVFWCTECALLKLTAPKINWLHCASNENLFYIWIVVSKRKFVLQNRQLLLAANRYFQLHGFISPTPICILILWFISCKSTLCFVMWTILNNAAITIWQQPLLNEHCRRRLICSLR